MHWIDCNRSCICYLLTVALGMSGLGAATPPAVTFTAYSEAAGTHAPPTGWAFYWNAPTNWGPGIMADLSSGAITDRASWKPLVWSGSMWTADGDTVANSNPSDHLRITPSSGYPGAAGATRELDRYAISAFTIQQAGDYQLLLGKIVVPSPLSNGLLLKIFLNGSPYDEIVVPNGGSAEFSHIFNGLASKDEIAVAVGANGNASSDAYTLDYRIALLKPEYANPQVINVADFGALGDGVTDDGPAVSAAIAAWKNVVGPAALHFESNKTYYLGERTESQAYFVLDGLKDKVVEGNNAELIFTPTNSGFGITGCDNIVVRNLSVDYSPLPFSQGVITNLNAANGTFNFRLSEGYSAPAKTGKPWGVAFDPVTFHITVGLVFIESITNMGNGNFEFKVNLKKSTSALSKIESGDLFVFRSYPASPVVWASIARNGTVAFDSVNLQSVPNFAFAPGYNTKPCLFRNITISPPPGSGRLVSSFSDGFHCDENRFGPVIEDGHFTYLMDDTINFKSMGFRIKELVGGTTIKLTRSDHLVGDVLQFTAGLRDVIGLATVTAVNGDETELDVLPTGMDLKDTFVFNLSRANAGYVVQNNYFGTKRRFAGVIRCGRGKLLNNVTEGNDGWWIGAENFRGHIVGPLASDILFQGNTLRDTLRGLWCMAPGNSVSPQRPIQNLRILDNVFETSTNLDINDAGNVLIAGNEFWEKPIGKLNNIGPITIGINTSKSGQPLTDDTKLFRGTFDASKLSFVDGHSRQ